MSALWVGASALTVWPLSLARIHTPLSDETTPRQALELLAQLKKLADET